MERVWNTGRRWLWIPEDRSAILAVLIAAAYLVLTVGIVFLAITLIKAQAPVLDFLFNNTRIYVLAVGIPMSIFAGLTSYYGKGEKQRMIWGILTAVSMGSYIFFVLGSMDIGWQEDELVYSITPTGFMLLFAVVFTLKGLYHIAEYYTYLESPPQAIPEYPPYAEP